MNELERKLRVFKKDFKRFIADTFQSNKPADQRPNIKMCPTCGRFNDAAATECSFCESLLQPKQQANVRADGAVAEPISPVIILFAFCSLVYIITAFHSSALDGRNILSSIWGPSGKALYNMGGNHPYFVVQEGQYWRTITYAMLHGNALHIFMNFSALASLGALVWECFGTRRFWLISLLTALGGGILSALAPLAFLSDALSGGGVGYSGALFGYLGALYMFFQQQGRTTISDRFKKYMIWGNVICIILSITGIFPIDNYGHLGGMFTGMALAAGFQNKTFRKLGDGFERLLIAGCLLLLAWGIVAIIGLLQG